MHQGRLPRVPVIVMTAAGDRWGYPAPPECTVKKPVDTEMLLALIRAIMPAPTDL